MARCYSDGMRQRQPALPRIWLISDLRNDALLERALERLPRGSGLIFRHYHLPSTERLKRFESLLRIARRKGHKVALSGHAAMARRWGADAVYGPSKRLTKGPSVIRLVTVHSLREIAAARRARADAILLSPVFATRSHPGGAALGPICFRLIAAQSPVPVIALGGMNAARARAIGAHTWAAVDGLCGRVVPDLIRDR